MMTKNNNNIWTEIGVLTNKKTKKFFKKHIKIKKLEKEKTISLKNNSIDNENTDKPQNNFINKKRGRRSKNEDNNIAGLHNIFSDDNIKKKVKTHYHNYIIALINSKLIINNANQKLRFAKIKSSITKNITVEYNQKLFDKKIKEIIIEVSQKYQNQLINKDLIDYVKMNEKDNKELIDILNMTYKDLYLNYYLKSTKKDFDKANVDESYEAHLKKLKKYGEKYLENYKKNAEGLIEFYYKVKKRKSRKKIMDETSYNFSNIIIPTDEKQNKDNYIHKEKDILHRSKNKYNNPLISSSTQTDIKLTEDEIENEYEN